MPNEVATSRFDSTNSGRYEPVPIILVRIIMFEYCVMVRCTVGGIIGLGVTTVNFSQILAFNPGSCYISATLWHALPLS